MAATRLAVAGATLAAFGAIFLAFNAAVWLYEALTCDSSSPYWGDAWCHIGTQLVWAFLGRWAALALAAGLVVMLLARRPASRTVK